MKHLLCTALTAALLTGALSLPTQAEQNAISYVTKVLTEVEIEDTTGNKVLERKVLEVATRNQKVIYNIAVTNSESQTASNIVLNIPTSGNPLIQPATFTSDIDIETSFSVDGSTFSAFKDIEISDGDETRSADPEDITHVRIDIPEIPRNETFFIEFDAIVK